MSRKKCDKKCVSKMIRRFQKRREYKDADFFDTRNGAALMSNFKTRKHWVGWPGLKVRIPGETKDGKLSWRRSRTVTIGLDFCPICGGSLNS